ncbi:anti-sigma factor [Flexivirga caeni]|uniref:Regulator of SigK n=1 Tax=Flexivirga caeni TaxID=2294115 RepID=A0A3M9M2R8_9MICO|nr:anti-sigma factor [Flexivirga caeni]RNI19507.1 anti-sigma factor [Flexivirga caeni]
MTSKHVDAVDYAMDALDDLARRAADRHLADCAQCRREVAEWRELTTVVGESVPPVAPPPALRETVLAAARSTPQESGTDRATDAQPSRPRARWLLAAAAALVLIAGGISVAVHPWSGHSAPASAVAQVTNAPDARRASKAVDGGSLVMVFSAKEEKAVATLQDVPAAATGKVYQAWFVTPSGMVDAGLLQPGKPTVLRGSTANASGAAVTVEPAGGSKQPTSKPIVVVSMS